MRFLLDNPKDYIQATLAGGEWYELNELELMKQYCKPNSIILDIGANVGSHAVYFSKFFAAKTIYVIEPIPSTYKVLLCNLCLNYCHNVNVDYIGIGLGHGNFIGYPHTIDKNQSGMVTLSPDNNGINPVKIIKGDDIFKDIPVDFIKIDVENMEMFVLEGLHETIKTYKPCIFLELVITNEEEFNTWIKHNNYNIMYKELCGNNHYNISVTPLEKNYGI